MVESYEDFTKRSKQELADLKGSIEDALLSAKMYDKTMSGRVGGTKSKLIVCLLENLKTVTEKQY